MKKLLLALAVTAGTLVFAQEKAKSSSPIAFGLKAGLNISTISSDDSKSKAGFYGGAFANIPVASSFSVQPEVLYNGLGAKYDGNSDLKINLSYISVPVMFQYKATPEFYLEAGPQFSFLIDSKLKYQSNSTDAKDLVKGFDFGIGIGAGYYFTPNIGVNVRYVAGVTDIAKEVAGNQADGKNNVFQVGLAYKFN
ncbi:opacity protein-like surface antigen [Chryseobacterium sp. H1D6B]|uniref:porin family protein n=1 Tax=Chryseobacterium sp. H1D6B TaxID=2940588 RepID=UPI0015C9305D|nr:porin family protein [Chryseobacterium sp. H1D6B]MDH6253732.1 opacity protein-like surface antigen [Chryseobacterium sp. H1D6B]